MEQDEIQRLRGLPHVAIAAYVCGVLPAVRADGLAPVSAPQIAAAVAIAAVPGRAAESVSRWTAQRALQELVRAGLVSLEEAGIRPLFRGPHQVRTKPEPATSGNERENMQNRDEVRTRSAPPESGLDEVRTEVRTDLAPASADATTEKAAELEEVRTEVRTDLNSPEKSYGSPLSSPPILPLINPLFTSPPIPTPRGYAHASESTDGAFSLTPPPSKDPEPVPPPPLDDRGRIPAEWVPTPATMKALAQKGMAPDRALQEVGVFVVYWSNATGNDARKRATGWQLAFVNWCRKLLPRDQKNGPHFAARGKSDETNPLTGGQGNDAGNRESSTGRRLGQSGQQAERIRQHFRDKGPPSSDS